MNKAIFLVVVALLVFYPIQSFAQDSNSWGSIFDCAVDWFSECKVFQENERINQSRRPLPEQILLGFLESPLLQTCHYP